MPMTLSRRILFAALVASFTSTPVLADCSAQTFNRMQTSSEGALARNLQTKESIFGTMKGIKPSSMGDLSRFSHLNFDNIISNFSLSGLASSLVDNMINQAASQVGGMLANQAWTAVSPTSNPLNAGVTLPGGVGQVSNRATLTSNGSLGFGVSANPVSTPIQSGGVTMAPAARSATTQGTTAGGAPALAPAAGGGNLNGATSSPGFVSSAVNSLKAFFN